MRIAYLFDQVLPCSATDTEQVIYTTTAMARAGADVTLVLPASRGGNDADLDALLEYYQSGPGIKLLRLPSVFPLPDAVRGIEKMAHALRATFSGQLRSFDVLYTRNIPAYIAALLAGYRVAYETYRPWPEQYSIFGHLFRFALNHPRSLGGVFHSEYSRQVYLKLGIPEEKLIVVHNGYDPARYTPPQSQADARAELDLPSDRPIFTYTGRVNMAKGLDIVLEMAKRHPEILVLIVGSEGEGEVEQRAREIENVKIFPWLTFDELPAFLFASDVLLLPPSLGPLKKVGNTVLPMKLFLYLAAGRAILAPISPDTTELLTHDVNAHLIPADDLDAASAAITHLVEDTTRTERLGATAREQAMGLTWDARAEKILTFLS